jgi:hypothetical protein
MSPALTAYLRAWRMWWAHEHALADEIEGVTEQECEYLGHAADRAYFALDDNDLDELARMTWPPEVDDAR